MAGTVAVPEDAPQAGELRVSTLELFFDLVFVFTLTQLTSALVHNVSLAGAARIFLTFIVLFWMYGAYVWLTNQAPPDGTTRRLLLIGAMAAFLVCALAIPHAFEGAGVVFGVGYLLVVLVHASLYAQAYGWRVLRFVPFNILGALCIVAAGVVSGAWVYVLWVASITLQYATAALTRAVDDQTRAGFDIQPGHFVERHGGLLIVAFGESVVAVGIGVGDIALDAQTIMTAVLGLVLVAALWWAYFDADTRRGEAALVEAPLTERVRIALFAYFYAYIPMLLGVIGLAAGVKLTIASVGAHLAVEPAILLAGGVALYLCGDLAFRRAVRVHAGGVRIAAVVVVLCTAGLGMFVAGVAELLGLVGTLVVMLAAERIGTTRAG